MARGHGRSRPIGRQLAVLCSFLVGGCAGSGGSRDAGTSGADGPSAPTTEAATLPTRPDARTGLASGLGCDASGECLSGACTMGVCSDWKHAMQIGIDTTSTGAGIKERVADFPLLVRLRSGNFVFAQARDDGADLRFVDSGGRTLSYEVELWDRERGVGDIWVSIPNIEGDSDGNLVLMYWGNPLATPASVSTSVFGAFACVLHLTADPDDVAAHMADASGHGNTGLVQNPATSLDQASDIAGQGLPLDGSSTYLATSLRLMSPQVFSVSLWFKTSSPGRAGIAGFASNQFGNDVTFDRTIWMDESGRLSFSVLQGSKLVTVSSLTNYDDGAWHLAVARLSGAGQYLFVDGESIADNPTSDGADSYNGSWRFGEEPLASSASSRSDAAGPTANFFSGTIDEIRVTNAEPSDAWIKLVYATQRPGATAVSYRPVQ